MSKQNGNKNICNPELLIYSETIQMHAETFHLIRFLILISAMQLFYVTFEQDKIVSIKNLKYVDHRNYGLFQLHLVIFSMVYIFGIFADIMPHMFS